MFHDSDVSLKVSAQEDYTLSVTKRRGRRIDPLASVAGVRRVLDGLSASMPDVIPHTDRKSTSLLNSVRGLYARQPTETNRGRPPRYTRELLLHIDSELRDILSRETGVSVRSFVGQYVPILDFPRDILEPLERGQINLFEAHQLARLTPKRLGDAGGDARALRKRLLEAHLQARGSGTQLRARVKELLGEVREAAPVEVEMMAVGKADELLEADPLDASHLFFEELRMISRALREIEPGEMTDDDLSEIMPAVDQVTLTLQKIARRRERKQLKKITI